MYIHPAVFASWLSARLEVRRQSGQFAALRQKDFGENQLQEALGKVEILSDLDCTWHFIGSIQTNKCRDIAAHFDWVHSVDRLKIARRLSNLRPATAVPLNIFLQVNLQERRPNRALPQESSRRLQA